MFEGYFSLSGPREVGISVPGRRLPAWIHASGRPRSRARADDLAGSGHPLRVLAIPDGEQTIAVLEDIYSRRPGTRLHGFPRPASDHSFGFSKQDAEIPLSIRTTRSP